MTVSPVFGLAGIRYSQSYVVCRVPPPGVPVSSLRLEAGRGGFDGHVYGNWGSLVVVLAVTHSFHPAVGVGTCRRR